MCPAGLMTEYKCLLLDLSLHLRITRSVETHNLAVLVNWEVLFCYHVFGIDVSDIWGSDVG